ncbi:MAG: hypothetical protein QW103_03080 [Candidatus Pacearchaeota archaeon]
MNKILIYTSIVVIILIVSGAYLYFNMTGRAIENYNKEKLAKYLAEKGAIMYGTEWCSFCNKQKSLFGDSFKYINYIDCDKKPEECFMAEIKGYPTWKIDGKNYIGFKSLEELVKMSGYK